MQILAHIKQKIISLVSVNSHFLIAFSFFISTTKKKNFYLYELTTLCDIKAVLTYLRASEHNSVSATHKCCFNNFATSHLSIQQLRGIAGIQIGAAYELFNEKRNLWNVNNSVKIFMKFTYNVRSFICVKPTTTQTFQLNWI